MNKQQLTKIFKKILLNNWQIEVHNGELKIIGNQYFYKSNYTWINATGTKLFFNDDISKSFFKEEKEVFKINWYKIINDQIISQEEQEVLIKFDYIYLEIYNYEKINISIKDKENNKYLYTTSINFNLLKKTIFNKLRKDIDLFMQKEILKEKFFINGSTLYIIIDKKIEKITLNKIEKKLIKDFKKICEKQYKNQDDLNYSIVNFFKKNNFTIKTNCNTSIDNGWGSYSYFNAWQTFSYEQALSNHIYSVFTYLYEKYNLQKINKLYLNSKPRCGFSLYTTTGGYTYVSG